MTPHVYTGVLPAIEAKYRELNSLGAFQLGGFLTYGTDRQRRSQRHARPSDRHDFRGYFEGNGRFQLDPVWSITSSLRAATDKTVTQRYDITYDDRLRNFVNAERIDTEFLHLSIAGWAFEGLRVDDVQKQIPIALPAIDARLLDRRRRRRQGRAAGQQPGDHSASKARTPSAPSPARGGTGGA